MSKKLYEDSNIQSIANAIRSKLGGNETYLTSEMAAAIAQIHGEPVLEALVANENGVYAPSTGKDGFSGVTVSVPASEPDLEELSVVQNGTYTPSTGKDGFSEVVVNVPSSGGGGGQEIAPGTVLDSVLFSGVLNIKVTNYKYDIYDSFEIVYKKTGGNTGDWPYFFNILGGVNSHRLVIQENRYAGRTAINVYYGQNNNVIFSGDDAISVGANIDSQQSPSGIKIIYDNDRLYFSFVKYVDDYFDSTVIVSKTLVADKSVASVIKDCTLLGGSLYLFPTNSNYFNNITFYSFIIRRNDNIIHEYVPFDNNGTLALKDLVTNDIIETENELASSAYNHDNTYYAGVIPAHESVFIEKNIIQNGTYDASDDEADGYSQVVVNVPSSHEAVLLEKTVFQNGSYNASNDNVDGYSQVIVNVPFPAGLKNILKGTSYPLSNIGENGDIYLYYAPYSVLRTQGHCLQIELNNWTLKKSDKIVLSYIKYSLTASSHDPGFLADSINKGNASNILIQENRYNGRACVNTLYNGAWAGDGAYAVGKDALDEIFDDVKTIIVDPYTMSFSFLVNNILVASGTLPGNYSSEITSSNPVIFPNGPSFDVGLINLKVYDTSGNLIHDYYPVKNNNEYGVYDVIDEIYCTKSYDYDVNIYNNPILAVLVKKSNTWYKIHDTQIDINDINTNTADLPSAIGEEF